MWKEVKWLITDSAKKVCDSVKVVGKNPKNMWLNDVVQAAVEGLEMRLQKKEV